MGQLAKAVKVGLNSSSLLPGSPQRHLQSRSKHHQAGKAGRDDVWSRDIDRHLGVLECAAMPMHMAATSQGWTAVVWWRPFQGSSDPRVRSRQNTCMRFLRVKHMHTRQRMSAELALEAFQDTHAWQRHAAHVQGRRAPHRSAHRRRLGHLVHPAPQHMQHISTPVRQSKP